MRTDYYSTNICILTLKISTQHQVQLLPYSQLKHTHVLLTQSKTGQAAHYLGRYPSSFQSHFTFPLTKQDMLAFHDEFWSNVTILNNTIPKPILFYTLCIVTTVIARLLVIMLSGRPPSSLTINNRGTGDSCLWSMIWYKNLSRALNPKTHLLQSKAQVHNQDWPKYI